MRVRWALTEKRDEQAIERLGDLVAQQDEHSQVESATRAHIRAIILQGEENEDVFVTACRIANSLGPDQLGQLIADWLEDQLAI